MTEWVVRHVSFQRQFSVRIVANWDFSQRETIFFYSVASNLTVHLT